MSTDLRTGSPLRLPSGAAETAASLPADGLRARLQELTRRGFSGRVELEADQWLAELLLRDGQPMAAAIGGPGLENPLTGQEALAALLSHGGVAWRCYLEPLDTQSLAALCGLAGDREARSAHSIADLRKLLRELALQRMEGILEVSSGDDWGRVLLGGGGILGAYSRSTPAVVASLAPLAEIPTAQAVVSWYDSSSTTALAPPTAPTSGSDTIAEVERHVTWIVSRFEGAWGRARERGASLEALQLALEQMVDSLLTLAEELESTADSVALRMALARLETDGIVRRSLADLDARLHDAGPVQACPILVGIVGEALDRVVRACPDGELAECCRQAARALDTELRVAFPSEPASLTRNGAEA